jgi:hypothetical protein
MELGRSASGQSRLLQEVTGLIRAQENRQLKTVGTVFVSQLGIAGLVEGEVSVAPLMRRPADRA